MNNMKYLVVGLMSFLPVLVFSEWVLPDTGQTNYYNNTNQIAAPKPGEAFYGQDAQYSRHALGYRDNGDGTIMDNNTGLMWQKNHDNIVRPWQEASDYSRDLDLAGHSDWRLPTRRELQSIVNFGRYRPAISTNYFLLLPSSFDDYVSNNFWTINIAGYTSVATPWRLGFYDGLIDLVNYTLRSNLYTRCVRGTPSPTPLYIDNGDDTVTDTATGLIWQQSDDGQTRTWQEALAYAESLEQAGYSDWRLPNIKELESIVDITRIYSPIYPAFQCHRSGSDCYWTSTTYVGNPELAWCVFFGTGYTWKCNKNRIGSEGNYSFYVRCVRGQGGVLTASFGASADYDGDAKADPGIYDEAIGAWKIKLSTAGYYLIATTLNGLGGCGYMSVDADYDGDGKADPAVYQELTGLWVILLSSSNYSVLIALSQSLGAVGYTGVPADYDGDRLADPCVFKQDQSEWIAMLSSVNYTPVNLTSFLSGFGGSDYKPVAADFDGDAKADPGLYGETNGVWKFKLSGSGYSPTYTFPQTLGGLGYLPMLADYDGDAKADPAIKSINGNEWIVMFSTGNYTPVPLTIPFE